MGRRAGTDPQAAARIRQSASARPPDQASPGPGRTHRASIESSFASEAIACAGSRVNGAGRGPAAPVSTLRVVNASPMKIASTAGTRTAALPAQPLGAADVVGVPVHQDDAANHPWN